MFSKGNKSASRRATPSIIGADCTFTGDVASEGEVQVDGRLEGDIRCVTLIIGEQGSVTGEISAETVSVLGMVAGQITARTVALAKTARILGDITHDSLSVEVGAYVEGRFNRLPIADAATTESDEKARGTAGQTLLSAPKPTGAANSADEDDKAPCRTAGGPESRPAGKLAAGRFPPPSPRGTAVARVFGRMGPVAARRPSPFPEKTSCPDFKTTEGQARIVTFDFLWPDLGAFFTVVLIDVALAGDNALVVGMAAAGLPPSQRRRAILIGIMGAALLRILFAGVAVQLMQIVGMTLAGGLLLLWVSWKLWREIQAANHRGASKGDPGDAASAKPTKTLPQAILQILLADLSMSLDNVLAVAGAARDSLWVLVAGLGISVILMAFAASIIARVIHRHHWIAYIGLLVVLYVSLAMIWDGGIDSLKAINRLDL